MLQARHVHVARTDEQARAEAEPELLKGFFGSGGLGSGLTQTRVGQGGDPRGTGGERSPDIDERGRVFRETARSYDFWIDNGLALVGSPATVVRLLREQRERVGYDVFLAQHQIADMPLEQVTTSMRLFAKEVMPAFADS